MKRDVEQRKTDTASLLIDQQRKKEPSAVALLKKRQRLESDDVAGAACWVSSSSEDDDDDDNGNRVGLVFEAAVHHEASRLHKERPARVVAVREALAKENLLQQCILYHHGENTVEETDYEQVHRQFYRTRCDETQWR